MGEVASRRPATSVFERVAGEHPGHVGARAVIVVDVERIADSCGWGVPIMEFVADRDIMRPWAEKKGADGLETYRAQKNARSLDGLPGLVTQTSPDLTGLGGDELSVDGREFDLTRRDVRTIEAKIDGRACARAVIPLTLAVTGGSVS